jgi:hypothetical protein
VNIGGPVDEAAMAQTLSTFEAGSSVEAIVAAVDQDGGAIAKDFLPADVIDELVRDMTPHFEAVDWCNTESTDKGTNRRSHPGRHERR